MRKTRNVRDLNHNLIDMIVKVDMFLFILDLDAITVFLRIFATFSILEIFEYSEIQGL